VQEDVHEVAQQGDAGHDEQDVEDHGKFLRRRPEGPGRVDARLTPLDAFLTRPPLGSER
jgi:hypothetical protein